MQEHVNRPEAILNLRRHGHNARTQAAHPRFVLRQIPCTPRSPGSWIPVPSPCVCCYIFCTEHGQESFLPALEKFAGQLPPCWIRRRMLHFIMKSRNPMGSIHCRPAHTTSPCFSAYDLTSFFGFLRFGPHTQHARHLYMRNCTD